MVRGVEINTPGTITLFIINRFLSLTSQCMRLNCLTLWPVEVPGVSESTSTVSYRTNRDAEELIFFILKYIHQATAFPNLRHTGPGSVAHTYCLALYTHIDCQSHLFLSCAAEFGLHLIVQIQNICTALIPIDTRTLKMKMLGMDTERVNQRDSDKNV